MTDDHESKGPLQLAVDLFVRAPVGFVLDLRHALTHPADSLDQLQTHAHRTLRALGIGTTSDETRGPLPDEPEDDAAPDDEAPAAEVAATADHDAGSPVVAGATVVGGIAVRVAPAEVHAPRPPTADPSAGPDPDGLAIPGYDSLSASQVVPRLESLSAVELDQVRQYELTNRGRKTILSKIAQLQA